MLTGFHSVDLVVPDLDRGVRFYRDVLGLDQVTDLLPSARGHDLRWVGLGRDGHPFISLLQPTGPGPVQRFLERRGPGVFQVCFDADDPAAAGAALAERGVATTPDAGSVFIHPRDSGGVLIEIMPGAA
jgi:methylmalonyl-CoA/ethylmalonyl-CoA epimerase